MKNNYAHITSTPTFVYSNQQLDDRAEALTSVQLVSRFTARYAAKANPHPEIIRRFDDAGLHFDASSSYEVVELLEQGIAPEKISLSSQQPAHNLDDLLEKGVLYVATSLHQLELFLQSSTRSGCVGLRVNPGLGAGHNNRTTTGGANSSFGLWNSYLPEALQLVADHNVMIDRLHVHVGSGADPHMWGEVMNTALELVDRMPDITSLDIGGGFKVHRFGDEQEADMVEILQVFDDKLRQYNATTERTIDLEVEPGTWLVAHAGTLVSEIVDIVNTGEDGHVFLRLDTGMNDFIRPSMYGAQHKMEVLSDAKTTGHYVVVGHNCETGDILTPAVGDPEAIAPRELSHASIGDRLAIYDVGAYCASFSTHGYNSFPNALEVFED